MIPPLSPTFDAALRDVRADKPGFRIASAHRLAEPPSERRSEALEGLLALADDETGAVREAAFEAIGELGASEALSQLVHGFDDPHAGARQAAVLAAGRVAPEESQDAVERLLVDTRPEMRFSALWTLSRLGLAPSESLARSLRDDDEEVRLLAVECIGEFGATEHLAEVAARLKDESERVRFAAAKSLAALGDRRGVSLLRAALADNDRAFDAAIGLGDLADPDTLPDLEALARARFRSPILRVAAARALVRLGDPLGARVIRRTVRSWRIEARQYAVQLVGELGLAELIPDLETGLKRADAAELPVYEAALERLAPESSEASALLASLRPSDHPG